MPTPKHPPTPHWTGDAVAPAPDGEAEAAATRAEGNGPALTQADADQLRPRKRNPTQIGYSPGEEDAENKENKENQEEKRQAAIEDHQADRAAGTGTAPKNI